MYLVRHNSLSIIWGQQHEILHLVVYCEMRQMTWLSINLLKFYWTENYPVFFFKYVTWDGFFKSKLHLFLKTPHIYYILICYVRFIRNRAIFCSILSLLLTVMFLKHIESCLLFSSSLLYAVHTFLENIWVRDFYMHLGVYQVYF